MRLIGERDGIKIRERELKGPPFSPKCGALRSKSTKGMFF